MPVQTGQLDFWLTSSTGLDLVRDNAHQDTKNITILEQKDCKWLPFFISRNNALKDNFIRNNHYIERQ